MFKKIDLVFTSHPTMIYDINGNIRKERPTIQKEIEQVNFFTKKVINYIKQKNIKNIMRNTIIKHFNISIEKKIVIYLKKGSLKYGH